MAGNSEKQDAEHALECLGIKVMDIVENANDAIIITDTRHRIVVWNRRAREMLGFQPEETLGKSVIEVIIPKAYKDKASKIVRLLEKKGSVSGESRVSTKNGEEIPVRMSLQALENGCKGRVGYLGVIADISATLKKEEQLSRQNCELEAFKQVAAALSGPMPFQELLQRAVKTILKAVSAEAGAIFLRDGKGATFSALAQEGAPEKLMEASVSFSLEGSFSGRVLKSQTGLILRDLHRVRKGSAIVLPATVEAGFRSLMGVPLLGRKGPLGTLEVASRGPGHFGQSGLHFLRVLGRQIAGEVENAQLREELSAALSSKARLLRESRHRLTNNLQTIASFLSSAMKGDQWIGDGRDLIESTIHRISGMAAIQEQMDRDAGEVMELTEVMERLELCLGEIYGDRYTITFAVKGGGVVLRSSSARSLGMAVNELVWNSCTHGFSPEQSGTVEVRAEVVNGTAKIVVADNGKGIPEGFDIVRDANTGLSIVRNLVERDLAGRLTLKRENGTMAVIAWPISGRSGEKISPVSA
ncbi:MAG: PAS domain S-box protein [bacterium]|nr:PAS domain S-box protein [bacterium]